MKKIKLLSIVLSMLIFSGISVSAASAMFMHTANIPDCRSHYVKKSCNAETYCRDKFTGASLWSYTRARFENGSGVYCDTGRKEGLLVSRADTLNNKSGEQCVYKDAATGYTYYGGGTNTKAELANYSLSRAMSAQASNVSYKFNVETGKTTIIMN